MTSGTSTWSFTLLIRLAFDQQIAAELAGEDDQRAIEQAALLEIEHQLRDGRVDLTASSPRPRVAVLVRVPVQERDVLRRHFDVARARLPPAAAPAGTRGRSGRPSAARTWRRSDPARRGTAGRARSQARTCGRDRAARATGRMPWPPASSGAGARCRTRGAASPSDSRCRPADRAGVEQLPVEAVALLEAPRRHAAGRAHTSAAASCGNGTPNGPYSMPGTRPS